MDSGVVGAGWRVARCIVESALVNVDLLADDLHAAIAEVMQAGAALLPRRRDGGKRSTTSAPPIPDTPSNQDNYRPPRSIHAPGRDLGLADDLVVDSGWPAVDPSSR